MPNALEAKVTVEGKLVSVVIKSSIAFRRKWDALTAEGDRIKVGQCVIWDHERLCTRSEDLKDIGINWSKRTTHLRKMLRTHESAASIGRQIASVITTINATWATGWRFKPSQIPISGK